MFTFAAFILCAFRLGFMDKVIEFTKPEGWPEPIYNFKKNPVTEEGFQLGRKLFYDPILSRDSTISCASCHLQYTGFTHVDHNVSHGIEGRKGTRNAPALINLAWNSTFHWDGGVNHLEVQPINPIEHPAEMDNTLEKVLAYLNSSREYRERFYKVFGDSMATSKTLLKAIAQYTVSLVSANSKYDKYMRGEADFTPQELNGLKLFRRYCSVCHEEPLFNSNEYKSNGLRIDPLFNDAGRYKITTVPSDSMKFRVPTLRNIEHTFPYMHDGRFNKLRQVLDHYTDSIDYNSPYLSVELKNKLPLDSDQKKDIIAFLKTLTDLEFLYNKRFSFPR